MARLERLLHVCGGLWFGTDLAAQLALMPAEEGAAEAGGTTQAQAPATRQDRPGREIPGRDRYDTLRFSCTPQVFQLIREEPNRFPPEHTAYSKPIPNLSNWQPGPLDRLEPNPPSDSHPYPVELDLPIWTLAEDVDLRTWLFAFAAGIRIAAGSDGIRDTWNPYGNGDMLERAMLIGYRGNYRRDEELAFTLDLVTTNAAKVLGLEDYGLRVGGPADLVVVEADTVAEAVATRPGRKMVIKAGRVVARDGALVS